MGPGRQYGDVEKRRPTVGDFVERARQTIDFAQGANAEVDLAEVPDELRHLAPLVTRWAFHGGGAQSALIEYWEEHQPQFVAEFCQSVGPFAEAIYAWNRQSVARENLTNPSLHLYVALVATYEMARPLDGNLIARNQKKTDDMLQARKRKADLDRSVEYLKQRNFTEVVKLLEPYESSLTPAELKRLELARKRL